MSDDNDSPAADPKPKTRRGSRRNNGPVHQLAFSPNEVPLPASGKATLIFTAYPDFTYTVVVRPSPDLVACGDGKSKTGDLVLDRSLSGPQRVSVKYDDPPDSCNAQLLRE